MLSPSGLRQVRRFGEMPESGLSSIRDFPASAFGVHGEPRLSAIDAENHDAFHGQERTKYPKRSVELLVGRLAPRLPPALLQRTRSRCLEQFLKARTLRVAWCRANRGMPQSFAHGS
jgi:hypothetical protein